jgi:hypothetical protein
MRALFRASIAALGIACAAPSLASAQHVQPYRSDPRWGQAPPWLGEDDVGDSARALASRAARMAQVVRSIEGYSELSDRAQRFARTANQLARELDSNAPYSNIMAGYDQLQREYLDLRGAFFAEHRTHHIEGVVDDWTSLVTSFERLSLDLGVEESQLCTLDQGARYGRYDDRYYDDRYDDRYGRYDFDPRYSRVPR